MRPSQGVLEIFQRRAGLLLRQAQFKASLTAADQLQAVDARTGKVIQSFGDNGKVNLRDNPIFPGLWEAAELVAGGSMLASQLVLDNAAVPLWLKDPLGATIYDDLQPPPADGSGLPVFYVSFSANTGTLGYPNTSAGLAGIEAGWTLASVDAFAATRGEG